MANGEAEAGSNADWLGGEEGVEDARYDGLWNAHAGIANLDHDAADPIHSRDKPDLVRLGVALRDRLGRVDDEVEDDLTEPRLVGLDERHLAVVPDQPRTVADLVRRHADRGFQDPVNVHRSSTVLVAGAREHLQIA